LNPPVPDRRPGRRQLLLVASLFFVPLVAASWLYLSSGWRPSAGVEHGELIDPPRPLPDTPLQLPDGSTAPVDALRRGWSLVYVGNDACGTTCRSALADMRQARLALDKDSVRVKRVLLHAGACCAAGFGSDEPDLQLLAASGPAGRALRAMFPPSANGEQGIYIVDPHGNLMMGYAPTGAARGILKDLERLLRLSNIG
jgi:cytochrome oxidase Cu insertion factor (SCO1/SenC/PrrC family)